MNSVKIFRHINSLVVIGAIILIVLGGTAYYFGAKGRDNPQPTDNPTALNSPISSTDEGETCSPPGTATCDGEGHPIIQAGQPSSTAILANGVKKLTDVGFRQIVLATGGTNGLDIDPESGLIYAVSNSTVGDWCGKPISKKGDILSIVEPDIGREIVAVATERGPVWPLVDVKNNTVYVAGSADGNVAMHRRTTGEQTGTIKVGGLPHDLGLDPESSRLFVSNTNNGSQKYIAVVDTQTGKVLRHHEVAPLPHRIALDAAKRLAYIVSVESGVISVFNTMNGQSAGQFETKGHGTIAFSPSKRLLFIPAKGKAGQPESINVINVDTQHIVGSIDPFLASAGHQAFGLAVDDKNQLLFASIGDSSLVGVADIKTLEPLAVFETNDCTWAVKVDSQRDRGFVTGVTTGTIGVFDIKKITSELKR